MVRTPAYSHEKRETKSEVTQIEHFWGFFGLTRTSSASIQPQGQQMSIMPLPSEKTPLL